MNKQLVIEYWLGIQGLERDCLHLNSKDTILPHSLPKRQQHALEKTETTFYSESEVLFDNQFPSYYP